MICSCLNASLAQLFYRYLHPKKVNDIIDMMWDKNIVKKVCQMSFSISASQSANTSLSVSYSWSNSSPNHISK